MSKFSSEQRAEIFRRSRQLLRDKDKPPGAAPSPEPPPLIIETEEQRWRRESESFERQCEAERAAMRREERESRLVARQTQDLAAIDVRLAELEGRMDEVERLSRAIGDFSDSVSEAMQRQDKLLEKLSVKLSEMRAIDDQHRAALDLPSGFIRKEHVN
jgi:hypothetical protein